MNRVGETSRAEGAGWRRGAPRWTGSAAGDAGFGAVRYEVGASIGATG